MPEYEALQGLPNHLDGLLKTSVLESKLGSHLNGAFKGAEMRVMQVVDELVQGLDRDPVANLKLKLGVLCSDLGKTGAADLSWNRPVNLMVESIYAIKDHKMNPDEVTLRQLVDAQKTVLGNEFRSRAQVLVDSPDNQLPDFETALADFYNQYGFNENTSLREFYNRHVQDSLETLDRGLQEIVATQPDILNHADKIEDFLEVRKIVALHHAYRFFPEGYKPEDVNSECLYAMAADIYDAVLNRPPLQGYDNSHESAVKMIGSSLNGVIKLIKEPNQREQLQGTVSDILRTLEERKLSMIKIFTPPIVVPENVGLNYFAKE